MKKSQKIVLLLLILMVVFREPIYNLTVTYKSIGERQQIKLTDKELIKNINEEIQNENLTTLLKISISRKYTNKHLKFTTNKVSNNPNKLIKFGKANCVGYSTLFNSIANYIIKKKRLKNKFVSKHLIGKLDFLGINLHQLFSDSFFSNHDFNQIYNIESNNSIWVDPSLNDYFRINNISTK